MILFWPLMTIEEPFLLLLTELAGSLTQILTKLVTPQHVHVLEGGLAEMLADVVESMLSDLTDV
jgi:hypothetical protein